MVETSDRFIIDYLLSSNRGELIKKNDGETNFMKIEKKRYRYDKTKAISDRLKPEFNKI